MPAPRFITSESQMGAPGVYVLENAPPVPTRGQRNRVIALAGECVRGPVDKPIVCVTYGRFLDVFGGRDHFTNGGDVVGQIWKALQGKRWGKLILVRAAAAAAVKATSGAIQGGVTKAFLDLETPGTNIDTVVEAVDAGIGGNNIGITFADGSSVNAGELTVVGQEVTFTFKTGVTTVLNFENAVAALTGDDKIIQVKTAGTPTNVLVTTDDEFVSQNLAGGTDDDSIQIDASSVGVWGNGLGYRITDATDTSDADNFNLMLQYGGRTRTHENMNATLDNFASIMGDDDANWALVTALNDGRPTNTPGDDFILLDSGADGSIADTDFTAANRAMEKIDSYSGVNACAVVGRSTSDVKDKAEELAAATTQKVWYICPDDEDVSYTDAIVERGTRTGGRLSYWFNHVTLRDGITRLEMVEEPFLMVLSIMSQTDPDIHPGDFDNTALTVYARRVSNELGPTVRDALDAAGVSFIHRDQDAAGNEVIIPGNALTCDLAINNRDLDGRYMKDFILDAVSKRLQSDQFKGNTSGNRAARASSVSSFLSDLARTERYVMRDEQGKALFSYTNNQSVNTLDENATGLQREVLIARLIPKNKQILLQAVVGVDATVSEQ